MTARPSSCTAEPAASASTAIMFAYGVRRNARSPPRAAPKKCAACLRFGAQAAIDYRTQRFRRGESSALTCRTRRRRRGRHRRRRLRRPRSRVPSDSTAASSASRCRAAARSRSISASAASPSARTIMGSSLRPRIAAQKAAIARELERRIWPLLPRAIRSCRRSTAVFPFDAGRRGARSDGSRARTSASWF